MSRKPARSTKKSATPKVTKAQRERQAQLMSDAWMFHLAEGQLDQAVVRLNALQDELLELQASTMDHEASKDDALETFLDLALQLGEALWLGDAADVALGLTTNRNGLAAASPAGRMMCLVSMIRREYEKKGLECCRRLYQAISGADAISS